VAQAGAKTPRAAPSPSEVLPRKRLKELDLQEFAGARPPQDCIGEWIDDSLGSSQYANTLV